MSMNVLLRGDTEQRLRIASGLILMLFALTHFLNHAMGLFGLEFMHQVQSIRTTVTRSIPGTVVLFSALCVHIVLGLSKLVRRSTLAMPLWEISQIIIGLAIPFLLLPHIVNTRIAHVFFDVDDNYLYELIRLWPDSAILQSTLLLLVWAHGCIGLHYWLRLSEGYERFQKTGFLLAVLVPIAALAGFASSALEAADVMSDPATFSDFKARVHWPAATVNALLGDIRMYARAGVAAVLLVLFGVAMFRTKRGSHQSTIQISYVDGPVVECTPGATILETSRAHKIPHDAICGGRARCTTCRITVELGGQFVPPPGPAERLALDAIEAGSDVRLACQVRPIASLTVAVVNKSRVQSDFRVEFIEVRELVGCHQRALLSGEITDFASASSEEVANWLRRKPYRHMAVPEAVAANVRLIGARLDYLRDRPADVLVYSVRNIPVSLFMLPQSDEFALAIRGGRGGVQVLGWNDEKWAYFAVGSLPHGELETLERFLQEPASPASPAA